VHRIAVLATSALLALPAAGGARTREGPSFAFGRIGGNIVPFRVEIRADGTLERSGPVRLAHPDARFSAQRLAGLVRFARTQRFWSLPLTIRCRGSLPDYAYLFVTIRTAEKTRTVMVRGGCSPRFSRVYTGLANAAAVVR
jgi:hypothetical protein